MNGVWSWLILKLADNAREQVLKVWDAQSGPKTSRSVTARSGCVRDISFSDRWIL